MAQGLTPLLHPLLYSIVLILNSIFNLLHITEELCECQSTLSADVVYYSKLDQDVYALIKELTDWSLTRT